MYVWISAGVSEAIAAGVADRHHARIIGGYAVGIFEEIPGDIHAVISN